MKPIGMLFEDFSRQSAVVDIFTVFISTLTLFSTFSAIDCTYMLSSFESGFLFDKL